MKNNIVKGIKKIQSVIFVIIMLVSVVSIGFSPVDIIANADVSPSPTVSEDVYLNVPETIYLSANESSGKYYFDLVCDQTLDTSSGVSTPNAYKQISAGGNVQFYCSNVCSAISLTTKIYKDDWTDIGGSVTYGSGSASNSNSLNTTVTGGYINSDTSSIIEWKITYTSNKASNTIYSYTYIYSVYKQPAFAATRAYSSRSEWGGELNVDIQSMAWVSGVHSSDGNGNRSNNSANFNPWNPTNPVTIPDNTKSNGGITQDSSTYHSQSSTASLNTGYFQSGDGKEMEFATQAVSPTAKLSVDRSRYSKYEQVPNLKVGFLISYVRETPEQYMNQRRFGYYLSDVSFENSQNPFTSGEESHSENNPKYYYNKRGSYFTSFTEYESTNEKYSPDNCNPRLVYSEVWKNKEISEENETIAIKAAARFGGRRKVNNMNVNVSNSNIVVVDVEITDKSNLREAVKMAMTYGYSNTDAYKEAVKILGKPDTKNTEIENAYNKIKLRVATAVHKSTTGKVKDIEKGYYLLNQDVTISKKSEMIYPGYTYLSAMSTCTTSNKENLFHLDQFAAHSPKVGSNNLASLVIKNGEITLTSGAAAVDNYTKQVDKSGMYKIKVTPGQTYELSYWVKSVGLTESNPNVTYAFYTSADVANYSVAYDIKETGNVVKEITVPSNMHYIGFRFGNQVKNATTNYSYITFSEKTVSTGSSSYSEIEPGIFKYSTCQYESISYTFIYEPNHYTVQYLPNGATNVTSIVSSSHTYEVAADLVDNPYIKSYKITFKYGNGQRDDIYYPSAEFSCWKVLDGTYAGQTLSNKASVKNLTVENGVTVRLEAQWGDVTNTTVPDDPESVGKKFLGWFETETGPDDEEPVFAPGSHQILTATEDKIYYARWEVSKPLLDVILNGDHDVEFDTNQVKYTSGDVVSKTDGEDGEEIKYTYKEEYNTTIILPIPTRENYTFVGWNRTNTNGTLVNRGNSYSYTFGTVDGVTDTIRAMWIPKTYYIEFLSGSVSWGPTVSNTKAFLYNSLVTAPADPIMTSYIFDGWDQEIPERMPGQDLTITAKWKDEPNAEYNKSSKAINDGYAVYFEGNSYSNLEIANYVKPTSVESGDNEIVLNPFNSSKAQAVAFNVNMTAESNAYVFLRAAEGTSYVIITGTKLDEEGNPVSKVVKVNSSYGQFYDVTDVLEPGKTGTVTIRQSGLDNEYTSYGYVAIGDIKLTTDRDESDKATLSTVKEADIDFVQGLIINVPEEIIPIDIPDVIFEKLITKIFIKKTNKDSTHDLDYKTTLTLYNEVENYAGKKITWYVDDGNGKFIRKASNKDGSLTLKNLTKSVKVKCVTKDSDGEEVSSEIETFTVKTGIWQKIVALFRGWFRKLPNVKY